MIAPAPCWVRSCCPRQPPARTGAELHRPKVDGIVLVPEDAQISIPTIRDASAAGIPIVLFNLSAAPNDGNSVAVVADNPAIARETAGLAAQAVRAGGQRQAAIPRGGL
jgi:ABC-type sugar transport system substrate-binding protein